MMREITAVICKFLLNTSACLVKYMLLQNDVIVSVCKLNGLSRYTA